MPIDVKRRKKVMSRSIKLGHCVCNPKKPCPCDTFKEHNICTCAGEKMPVKSKNIALTQYVRKAGCASKIGQADLLRILSTLPQVTDPNVLLGTAAGDDAGIYRLDDHQSLVQTVDVFTPCVDNPYLFGQIAAANSVSDVYAMGGRPITALSVIGFPIDELDGSIMEAILKGGMDKLLEADCSLIGGHSINDQEIKCGFAVTGLIETTKTVQRDKVCAGDVLILTKPLGTGIVSFAAQIGRISDECLNEAGVSMATLNKDAAELMVTYNAHACTDVTGYGLMGHLVEMVHDDGLAAEIDMSALPVFAAVKECLEQEIMSGAIERNQDYSMAWVNVEDDSGKEYLPILYDTQTSGGLLISMQEEHAEAFTEDMKNRGHSATSVIGRIVEKDNKHSSGKVVIMNTRLENLIGRREGVVIKDRKDTAGSSSCCDDPVSVEVIADSNCCSKPAEESCCALPPTFDDDVTADSLAVFKDFMKQVSSEGLIDKRVKKLMAIALSVAQRCKPCLIIHIKSALSMGISGAEIDEAVNLAIAFSGCPAMTFYQEVCKEIDGMH